MAGSSGGRWPERSLGGGEEGSEVRGRDRRGLQQQRKLYFYNRCNEGYGN